MKHDSRHAADPPLPNAASLAALGLCYPAVLALSYVLKPSAPVHAVILAPHALIFAALRLAPLRRWVLVMMAFCAMDCLVMTMVLSVATGVAPGFKYVLTISLANQLIVAGMVASSEAIRHIRFLRRRFLLLMPLLVVALVLGAVPGVLVTVWLHALKANLPVAPIDIVARLLGCVLGVVACCPLLFGMLRGFREPAQPAASRGELLVIGLVSCALAAYLMLLRWPLSDRFTELILLAMPLFWLALRSTRRAVAIVIAAMVFVIAFAAAHGMGAFAPLVEAGRWNDGIVSTQIFLLLISCEALLINRAMLERGKLLEKYRHKQSQLAGYAAALNRADESARRATAADLHDGVGQILAGQGLILGSMRRYAQDAGPLREMLDQALAASQEAQTAVRHTIQDLHPPELDGASIAQMLASIAALFATRYEFRVNWSVQGDAPPRLCHPLLLYRVIKELIYNAYKHARVREVAVAVTVRPGEIETCVVDRGVGFEAAGVTAGEMPPAGGGFGLLSLAERVSVAGGRVAVESTVGAGCRARVWLPVDPGAAVDPARTAPEIRCGGMSDPMTGLAFRTIGDSGPAGATAYLPPPPP